MKRFEYKTQLDWLQNRELDGWRQIESKEVYGRLTGDLICFDNKYQRELPDETKEIDPKDALQKLNDREYGQLSFYRSVIKDTKDN